MAVRWAASQRRPRLPWLFACRVGGALENKPVRAVAAGLHLTVAVTTGGRVFQMGCTGASAGKHCPWEGATAPELVKGALAGGRPGWERSMAVHMAAHMA